MNALAEYETKFADENVRNFHAPVKFERLRAMIRLDRLDEAEEQTAKLVEEWPNAAQIPLAFSMLSSAYSKKARDQKEAKDTAGWAVSLKKAAKYFTSYTETRTNRAITWQEAQILGFWYFDLDDLASAEPWLEKALEGLGEAIVKAQGDTKEKLEKQYDGLLQKLAAILLQQKKYGEAKSKLEALLILDEGAKSRVLEILKMQELSPAVITELMSKIRPIPSLMENLATTYKHVGGPDDLLRALTLILVLERADPENKYTDVGWRRKLLRCQIYLQYGRDFRDQAALQNVINLVNNWETLGVLDNCSTKDEFFKVRAEASRLLTK